MAQAQNGNFSVFALLFILLIASWAPVTPAIPQTNDVELAMEVSDEETSLVSARSVSTWSGNVWLNSSYTVAVTDELVIDSCTHVWMDSGVRVYVDGRLTVEGTSACPVTIHSQGGGDHEGIQFNSSSTGRGSKVDNLTMVDGYYGVTMYGGDAHLNNLTVEDPDYVGVDLFNSATPIINDLTIEEAGQDVTSAATWRYGIGLSVGNLSTPVVNRVNMDGLITRGLNFWGNSGGLFNNLTISNVSGASLAVSAGVWVMDARPLIQDLQVDRCDNGVVVRHYDDSISTRGVMRRVTIDNSMYRGLYVDKYDHSNYTNYEAADITDLVVRGTGGLGAKTPGLAEAAVEVNASGMWLERALIEDNNAPGIRLYFVDSTTNGKDISITRSGEIGVGAHSAGLTVRSSYFAPDFSNLTVTESEGAGVWAWGGGALQGDDWTLTSNTQQGLYIDGATVWVDGLEVESNGLSAVRVNEGRSVELWNLNSRGNGHASSGASDGAGMVFIESNNVESQSGDVRCWQCSSTNDSRGGVYAVDSVDLVLQDFAIYDPENGTSPIYIDNGGLTASQEGGWVDMYDIETWTNNSVASIHLEQAAANIDGLEMHGNHAGLVWNGDHNLVLSSSLSNANLSGAGTCLDLDEHTYLTGAGITLSSDCTGTISLDNTIGNWSGLSDETGLHALVLDSNSDLRLHQPSNVDLSLSTIPGSATIAVAWDFSIWVVNQRNNGVPQSNVDVDFDQHNQNFSYKSDWIGFDFFPNWVGQLWTSVGPGTLTQVSIDCAYDNTTNSTNITLDSDQIVYCHLDLANQPPFINWTTPQDGEQFPSGGEILFNASASWDLDDDYLYGNWTSNIDGNLPDACTGQGIGQGQGQGQEGMYLIVNNFSTGSGCPLSDGIHDITFEVCDDYNCAYETRQFELTNLPPILSVGTEPPLDPDGVLRIPWTTVVHFDAYTTYDPEGDQLITTIRGGDCFSGDGWWSGQGEATPSHELEWNVSFAPAISNQCTVTLSFSDGVNPIQYWNVNVELDNELPQANFSIVRAGNASEDLVTLDGSATVDPEGDTVVVQWISSLDGLIGNGSGPSATIWNGYLTKGIHTITMRASDDTVENTGDWSDHSLLITVDNSQPRASISSPPGWSYTDSGTMIDFIASGSGDWDAWCSTFPSVAGVEWHCSPNNPAGGSDWLQVTWESNVSGVLANDWLVWSGRLPVGNHTITITVDDGLSEPATSSIEIDVAPSPPSLGLITPSEGEAFTSADTIWWDASNSTDWDGDAFNLTLTSSLMSEPILEGVDPYLMYTMHLPAGSHDLTIILEDERGLQSTDMLSLIVIESGPDAVMTSPENGRYYPPASALLLSANDTVDWDDDIVGYAWFEYQGTIQTSLLTEKWGEVMLEPGTHHIALYVEDTRGVGDWAHANITLGDSTPKLNQSSLTLSKTTFTSGELSELTITIEMEDLDGTTNIVEGLIKHGLQEWEFNFNDEGIGRDLVAGDDIWTASLDFRPEGEGRPHLRIIAIDGSGDEAKVSTPVTRDLTVELKQSEISWALLGGSVAGIIGLIFLLNLLVAFRRRRLASLDVVESWNTFSEATTSLEQADAVDAAEQAADESVKDADQIATQEGLSVAAESGKVIPDIE